MSLSKDLHDRVVTILSNMPQFREVISGVVPSPSQVRKFPTCAIDYVIVNRKVGQVGNTMDTTEEIDLYVYNQQKANKFEDILSDLISDVDKALQTDTELRDKCIDNYIKEVVTDGGTLSESKGRSVGRLTLFLRYTERCSR